MKLYFFFFLILLNSNSADAQKASIHIRLVDSSSASASDYIFELEVRNNRFDKYWVEDTAQMRTDVMGYPLGLFNIRVSKYGNDGLRMYENLKKHQGDRLSLVDSCETLCCNCVVLEKKQSVKIKLPLLTNYNLEKGHYIIEVAVHPPAEVCHLCDQMREIYTEHELWVN
jgi:hypothetical protein